MRVACRSISYCSPLGALICVLLLGNAAIVAADNGEAIAGFGEEIGKGLAKGFNELHKWAGEKAKFNAKLAEARKAYWSGYPDAPGLAEKKKRYRGMLAEKDFFLVTPCLVSGPTEGLGYMWAINMMAGGTDLDGGVRAVAVPALKDMAGTIRESAGLKGDPGENPSPNQLLIIPSASVAKAIAANADTIDAYFKARDRGEMLMSLDVVHLDGGMEYLAHRLFLEGEMNSLAEARQYLQEIETVLGPGHIEAVAGDLRKQPKNFEGQLISPEKLGPYAVGGEDKRTTIDTRELLDAHVGHGDARSYLIALIHLHRAVSWSTAAKIFENYWVKPFGKDVALAAAERVRKAPKDPNASNIFGTLHRKMAGAVYPAAALRKLMPYDPYRDYPIASLKDKDPQKYLYAVMRQFGGVKYWSEAPAAYDALRLKSGHVRFNEAAANLLAAAKNSDGTLADAKSLGVSSDNPWEAFNELLKLAQASPRGYLADLFHASLGDLRSQLHDGAVEYDVLTSCFGQKRVDEVIAQVRQAHENKQDLAKLEGAVSGFDQPVQTILDILWATAPREQYFHYLMWRSYGRYSNEYDLTRLIPKVEGGTANFVKKFGQDIALEAAEQIARSPKHSFSVEEYSQFDAWPLLVDVRALGLPAPAASASRVESSVVMSLNKLAERLQQKQSGKTAFALGDRLQLRSGANWENATIVQVTARPGTMPGYRLRWDEGERRPFFRNEKALKHESRPIAAEADPAGDEAVANKDESAKTGEPGVASPAPEPDAAEESPPTFAVGAKVRFKTGSRVYEATVVRVVTKGWYLVEYKQVRGRRTITRYGRARAEMLEPIEPPQE